jgi:hypothetical protein
MSESYVRAEEAGGAAHNHDHRNAQTDGKN